MKTVTSYILYKENVYFLMTMNGNIEHILKEKNDLSE